MCFGEAGGGQQQRNEWLHYGTSPIRYTEVRRTRSGAGQFRVTPTHPFPADPMRLSRQPPGKCRRVSKPGQKDIVSAENGTVRFDERGVKRSMMGLRHGQTKGSATDRPRLNRRECAQRAMYARNSTSACSPLERLVLCSFPACNNGSSA
jgi:hypothetical protein